MSITISVKVNQTPSATDELAMQLVLSAENDRLGETRESPIVIAGKKELKQWYETYLNELIAATHASYIRQAEAALDTKVQFKEIKQLWGSATEEQQAAAKAALGG